MNLLKKFSLLALILSISLAVYAQPHHPHHRGMFGIAQFEDELDLTDEQKTSIEAIQEKYKDQLDALHEEAFEDRKDRREAFHELMSAQKAEIAEVLTDEQKAILKDKHQEMRERHREARGQFDKEGFRTEMKAYHEQEILPVLKAQRAKLEEKISAEDKATIARLRTELKHERKEMNRKHRGDRQHKREGHDAFREAHQEDFETLKALAEKYSDEIKKLHDGIEPQIQKWEADKKAIIEKYRPEGAPEGRRGHKEHGKDFQRHAKRARMGHFLLMDPAADPAPASTGQALTELNVYPNPANDRNTLNYTLREAGKIRIELRDEQGNLLKVLLDDRKEAGAYTLEADLSTLNDGIYYYFLTDSQGTTSRKVVVSKR